VLTLWRFLVRNVLLLNLRARSCCWSCFGLEADEVVVPGLHECIQGTEQGLLGSRTSCSKSDLGRFTVLQGRGVEKSVETRELGRIDGRVREGWVEGNVKRGKMKGVRVRECVVGSRSSLMRAVTKASYPVCVNSPDC
jgi:hypothetical protein